MNSAVYRDQLRADLTRHNVEVKVQEDFKDLGGDTLDKLDIYISHCDAVVHLVGDMTGSYPGERGVSALLAKYPDLTDKLPPLGEALKDRRRRFLHAMGGMARDLSRHALVHAKAAETAMRGPKYAPTAGSRAAQALHLARLKAVERYPRLRLRQSRRSRKNRSYAAILDLLVKDYAEESARARDVAEGFIRRNGEEGLRATGTSISKARNKRCATQSTYTKERSPGGKHQTNIDAIVDEALGESAVAGGRRQVRAGSSDASQSGRGDAA